MKREVNIKYENAKVVYGINEPEVYGIMKPQM
jgi:hypothetical protein